MRQLREEKEQTDSEPQSPRRHLDEEQIIDVFLPHALERRKENHDACDENEGRKTRETQEGTMFGNGIDRRVRKIEKEEGENEFDEGWDRGEHGKRVYSYERASVLCALANW